MFTNRVLSQGSDESAFGTSFVEGSDKLALVGGLPPRWQQPPWA